MCLSKQHPDHEEDAIHSPLPPSTQDIGSGPDCISFDISVIQRKLSQSRANLLRTLTSTNYSSETIHVGAQLDLIRHYRTRDTLQPKVPSFATLDYDTDDGEADMILANFLTPCTTEQYISADVNPVQAIPAIPYIPPTPANLPPQPNASSNPRPSSDMGSICAGAPFTSAPSTHPFAEPSISSKSSSLSLALSILTYTSRFRRALVRQSGVGDLAARFRQRLINIRRRRPAGMCGNRDSEMAEGVSEDHKARMSGIGDGGGELKTALSKTLARIRRRPSRYWRAAAEASEHERKMREGVPLVSVVPGGFSTVPTASIRTENGPMGISAVEAAPATTFATTNGRLDSLTTGRDAPAIVKVDATRKNTFQRIQDSRRSLDLEQNGGISRLFCIKFKRISSLQHQQDQHQQRQVHATTALIEPTNADITGTDTQTTTIKRHARERSLSQPTLKFIRSSFSHCGLLQEWDEEIRKLKREPGEMSEMPARPGAAWTT